MDVFFDNRFGIISMLILFGAFNGFLVSLLFVFNKQLNDVSNRLFAAIIVIFALQLTEMGLVVYGQIWKFAFLSGTTYPLLFLIGPLYYFYTKRSLNPAFKFRWIHLLAISPAVAHFFRNSNWIFADLTYKKYALMRVPVWELPPIGSFAYILQGLIIGYTIVFLVLALQNIRKQKSSFENQLSDNNILNRLSSLRVTTIFLIAYTVSFLILYILLLQFGTYGTVLDRAWLLILSIMIHIVGYYKLSQPNIVTDETQIMNSFTEVLVEKVEAKTNPPAKTKYKKSGLSIDQARVHLEIFSSYMIDDKPFLKQDLRISEVSETLNIPTQHLSQALSQLSEHNFFNFVNQYRIEEAKRLLLNPEYDNLTILAVALDAGFNNKASFNRAFKKFVGTTPSEFRRRNSLLN